MDDSIKMTVKTTLNALHFTKHQIAAFSGIVKNIMEVRGKGTPTSHRLYPRNTPEILINFGQPLKGKTGNNVHIVRDATIQGSKRGYLDVNHPEQCHFISLRFTTNGLYKLLGIPQYEFTDQLFQLNDIINRRELKIPKRIVTSSDQEENQQLYTWLYSLISNKISSKKLLSDFIIEHLTQNPSLTVNKLTELTGYTRKHLAKCFKEETGLTIKRYLRIYRMYCILKQVKNDESPDWSKLVYQFGFYDQSHFIRDFKQLTGFTPTEYSNLSKEIQEA